MLARTFSALVLTLLLAASPALAAAPETPETLPASNVTGSAATLHGVLNPQHAGEAGNFEFTYRQPASECQGEGESDTPAAASVGNSPEPVEAQATGLLPATTYTFCLRATDQSGESAIGSPQTFTTPTTGPTIGGEAFSNVTSSTAVIAAQVDPGGLLTSYRAEYVTDAQFQAHGYAQATDVPAQEADLPAASSPIGMHVELAGLQPDTVYHARVFAQNAIAPVTGADLIFATLPGGILGLPDGRVYEMVTPPDNQDADVYGPNLGSADFGGNDLPGAVGDAFSTELPWGAAAGGEAVAYVGSPTSAGNGASGGGPEGNEYLARRSPDGGWTQTIIQPPGFPEARYEGFSSDLSLGVIVTPLAEQLTANAPQRQRDLYARSSDGSLHPLVANVHLNRGPFEFGAYGLSAETLPIYAGSSANSEHLLFVANDALTPAAESNPPSAEENDLYDSIGGHVTLVNLLPDGEPAPDAIYGSASMPGLGREASDFSHVISEDGRRIFWTALHPGPDEEHIFLRLNDDAPQSPLGLHGECTIAADACTIPVSVGPARFWTATADGHYVIYTEGERLWRFDTESDTRTELAGAGAGVQGVSGFSDDGAYAYFVASGALTSDASDLSCQQSSTQAGEADEREGRLPAGTGCNLYLWHDGITTLITTLGPRDGREAPPYGAGVSHYGGDWISAPGEKLAGATPDGKALVFVSSISLTGSPSEGYSEVYRYEVGAHVVCVSCSRSGEPPRFGRDTELANHAPAAAAILPIGLQNTHTPRWMSDDGSRVFFDSDVPLVPQDANEVRDVYEWERDGAGSCRESRGCQYLLSNGTSTAESFFADASASGDDVFIGSRAQLVPQDGNEAFNLFDVRVGGVSAPSLPACTGSGCQGVPPAPPIFATPSSVTFNGVGNFPAPAATKVKPRAKPLTRAQKLAKALKACRKQPKRKRAACQAQARKRYAPKSNVKSAKGRK